MPAMSIKTTSEEMKTITAETLTNMLANKVELILQYGAVIERAIMGEEIPSMEDAVNPSFTSHIESISSLENRLITLLDALKDSHSQLCRIESRLTEFLGDLFVY